MFGFHGLGQDVLVDSEKDADAFMKEDQGELRMLLKKIWPPIIFLYTIFVGWDDPVMLAARVVIFLLGSRPSPSSIYLFVEQVTTSYFTWKLLMFSYVKYFELMK